MEKVETRKLRVESSKEWVQVVMSDFPAFLQDHANCERKASAMAMSFVAKYPDRQEIIPELIDTAIEELSHFRQVHQIMMNRGIMLPAEMGKDLYVKGLIDACRSTPQERFLDRLVVASVVEYRGAERFRLVYENLEDADLKNFYRNLYLSEYRHGEVFLEMARLYFAADQVEERLDFLYEKEAEVLTQLPLKSALH